ncbi:ParB/RepB/Spo0J family partition protein [Amycolatopsis sp. NPDC051903]|uniref:ParB/RepB/Spo0J family partition protein n=1 Tax=Amycolatopsis sp. NPDC051903 TaxID=3363936 RepID=UPI00379E0A11
MSADELAARRTPHLAVVEAGDAVCRVPIDRLTIGDSPRLTGQDEEHVARLAEADTPMPPILVHYDTMLVIDGVHRIRAAQLRGEDTIAVEFKHCELSQIFVLAVSTNISHGLPLSLADRKAAAARILRSHPDWSDRAIGGVTGLDHKTVGRVRRDRPGGLAAVRVARARRSARRGVAEEIMARQPNASLRQVAKAAGISVSTAHDVRKRITAARPEGEQPTPARTAPRGSHGNAGAVLRKLATDPSLRHTDGGRTLLRLLNSHRLTEDGWRQLAISVPAHWTAAVADLAREHAMTWLDFAAALDQAEGGGQA